MKNTLLVCAALFALSACAQKDGDMPDPDTIDQVQKAALIACVLFPSAKEIADIYIKDKKQMKNAQKIADILCDAAVKAGKL